MDKEAKNKPFFYLAAGTGTLQNAPPAEKRNRNRSFFYLLLGFTFFAAFALLRPYLGVIVFAFVTVVTFKPIFDFFLKRVKGRTTPAVTLTIISVLLAVLIPLSLIINLAVNQALEFSDEVSSLVAGTNTSVTDLLNEFNRFLAGLPYLNGYQITEAEIISLVQRIATPLSTFLAQNVVSLGGNAADLITRTIIFLSLIAALFPALPHLIELLKDLSPLDDELDQKYVDRIIAMTKAMVKGVFVIAIVQGLTAGLFFAIAGVRFTFFWTMLSIFLAVLPLGVNAIAIPIGIVLLILGNIWQGILVLVGSLLVVSNLDNLLRPRLVSKDANLNPALVLLSAFGGLNLFGFLGVIYGPVVMIFLITTVEIYLEHYQLKDAEV